MTLILLISKQSTTCLTPANSAACWWNGRVGKTRSGKLAESPHRTKSSDTLEAQWLWQTLGKFISKHCMCERMDRAVPIEVTPGPQNSQYEPDEKLTTSLAVLGETLQQARPQIFTHLQERSAFWRHPETEEHRWGYSEYVRTRLLKSGWCSYDVYRLESITPSVSAMYYASDMKPQQQSRNHSKCSWLACVAPKKGKKVMHIDVDCTDCAKHGVVGGDAALTSIIEDGKTPMVTWTKEGLQVKGYDLQKDTPSFGAVSHAWEDRILASNTDASNQNDRKAHQCQLKHLQLQFDDLLGTSGQPFWVDILCIPRDASVKGTAIDQTKDIYHKAGAVLVWDRGLLGCSKSDNKRAIENNLRIITSDWSQRLWTFSETVRAENLHIAFDKGTVSVKTLEKARDLARDDMRHQYHHIWKVGRPFSSPVAAFRETQPERKLKMGHRPRGAAEEQDLRVQRAWHAVQFRSVTEPTDETLVLAHVLEMDVKEILKVNPSDPGCAAKRMVLFLDLLDATPGLGVPSGIIFLPGPHLRSSNVAETKGYGWAPRSWLTRQAHAYPLLRALRPTAGMHKRGLLVTFPGVLLHCPAKPIRQGMFWIPAHQTMHKWYKVTVNLPESDVADFWRSKVRPNGDTSIIMSAKEPRDRWEVGLLVQKKGKGQLTRGTVRWVERLCTVFIRLETNPNIITEQMTRVREHGDEMMLGERLEMGTQWCIDGDE